MDLPQKFGKYTLLRRLATGGMAEIFLARQQGMGGFEKEVVVKRLLPTHAQNEELVTMFLDEARIAANLTHPNIAQIFDLGRAGDDYFIAMEFVRGVDLRRLCAQGIAEDAFLPRHHAVRIVAEVCDALAYAHAKTDDEGRPMHIVHRDVSPTNVLITYEGGVKLVDFGIAKASNKANVTKAGQIKGKFGYMAPEQALGGHLDHRTDLFAVGINLYEITVGRRLFKGDNEVETLEAIEAARVVPPREVDPDYPEALERIVLRALARDPDARYQSARDLQMALEEYLASAGMRSTAGMLAEYVRSLFAEQIELEVEESARLREEARALEDEGAPAAEPAPAPAPALPAAAPAATPSAAPPLAPDPTPIVDPWASLNRVEPPPTAAEMGVDPTPAPSAPASARPDLVPDPSVLLTEDDLRIRKPRSYTGLLMLLLIAVGAFALYQVMQGDMRNPRERGNPNIQVAPPSLQDLTRGSEDVELPPPPKKAMLRLDSDPPGARVVVNGNVVSSVTPTAIQTFVGRFADVRMLMPGRLPQTTRVKVDQDEVEVKLALEEGVPPVGSLYVETAPAGAELSLNGNAVGITPIKLPKVAANTEMTLALRKEGYYPHLVTYTLAEGEERDLGVRLIQDTGPRSIAVVNVESIPLGAEVTELREDGENKVRGRTGRYPVKLNVPIDRPLHLRAEAERHAPAETFLDVREPFYTLYLRLPAPEAFHGKLSIIGAKGLVVFVGSEEVGTTPVRDHALTEGDHTVVVFDEKSRTRKSFEVRVERNKTVEKSVVLEGETITVQ